MQVITNSKLQSVSNIVRSQGFLILEEKPEFADSSARAQTFALAAAATIMTDSSIIAIAGMTFALIAKSAKIVARASGPR